MRVRVRVDSLPPVVHAELPCLPPHELAHRREGHVQREHDVVAHDLVQLFSARPVLVAMPPSGRTGIEGRARCVGQRRAVRTRHLVELVLHLYANVSYQLMHTKHSTYMRCQFPDAEEPAGSKLRLGTTTSPSANGK